MVKVIKCDICGKVMKTEIIYLNIGFGYGSIFDDDHWDICSDLCLLNFIKSKEDFILKNS